MSDGGDDTDCCDVDVVGVGKAELIDDCDGVWAGNAVLIDEGEGVAVGVAAGVAVGVAAFDFRPVEVVLTEGGDESGATTTADGDVVDVAAVLDGEERIDLVAVGDLAVGDLNAEALAGAPDALGDVGLAGETCVIT